VKAKEVVRATYFLFSSLTMKELVADWSSFVSNHFTVALVTIWPNKLLTVM
jgi:hypothetical protein